MKRALLFDLDDTLVVEEPAAAAAFLATAQVAVARHRVQADRLALTARERARELWYANPPIPIACAWGSAPRPFAFPGGQPCSLDSLIILDRLPGRRGPGRRDRAF
jgi:FMN phosphatase YigB (HAD superfamily)